MGLVNHPRHYNARKDGIECINIVRNYTFDIGSAIKYLWRAGLKTEEGMTDREKEIEDLEKTIWCVRDYRSSYCCQPCRTEARLEDMERLVLQTTGYSVGQIVEPYDKNVADAMTGLLMMGLIVNGHVVNYEFFAAEENNIVFALKVRIEELMRCPSIHQE